MTAVPCFGSRVGRLNRLAVGEPSWKVGRSLGEKPVSWDSCKRILVRERQPYKRSKTTSVFQERRMNKLCAEKQDERKGGERKTH